MFKKIYDISVTLGSESIDYPGDTPYSRKLISAIARGQGCDVSEVIMTAHTGTHIDAPAHFIQDGKTVDGYSAEDFIFSARVVNVGDKECIGAEDVPRWDTKPGDALLFKTDNSRTGRCRSGVFSDHYVYLTPEGAACCVERQVGLVGLDYASIDRYGDNDFTSHRTLLNNGILILEGINLKGVPEGLYVLFCLPLKMKGAEASPVRAVLCCY